MAVLSRWQLLEYLINMAYCVKTKHPEGINWEDVISILWCMYTIPNKLNTQKKSPVQKWYSATLSEAVLLLVHDRKSHFNNTFYPSSNHLSR